MKKLALYSMTLFLMAIFFVLQSQAQESKKEIKKEFKNELKTEKKTLKKLQGVEVSKITLKNFLASWGNLPDVKWKRLDYFDEATFTKDGKDLKAYYDVDGNLVGTTTKKDFSNLPAIAQDKIKTDYKNYTIGPVIFFNDNEANDTDMALWNTQFNDQDAYFVEMAKGNRTIILMVDTDGDVTLFTEL